MGLWSFDWQAATARGAQLDPLDWRVALALGEKVDTVLGIGRVKASRGAISEVVPRQSGWVGRLWRECVFSVGNLVLVVQSRDDRLVLSLLRLGVKKSWHRERKAYLRVLDEALNCVEGGRLNASVLERRVNGGFHGGSHEIPADKWRELSLNIVDIVRSPWA
jgi:hypothetical protein